MYCYYCDGEHNSLYHPGVPIVDKHDATARYHDHVGADHDHHRDCGINIAGGHLHFGPVAGDHHFHGSPYVDPRRVWCSACQRLHDAACRPAGDRQ